MAQAARTAIVTLGLLVAAGSPALAQPQFPQRPTYSPYLNLLRPGSTAINYYGLVRPQQDARNQFGALQQQVGTLNQDISAGIDPGTGMATPATGHRIAFLSYGPYYPGLGGNRGGRAGGGATGLSAGTGVAAPNVNAGAAARPAAAGR